MPTPRTPIRLKDLEIETSDLRRNERIDPEGAEWWAYVRRRDPGYGRAALVPSVVGLRPQVRLLHRVSPSGAAASQHRRGI